MNIQKPQFFHPCQNQNGGGSPADQSAAAVAGGLGRGGRPGRDGQTGTQVSTNKILQRFTLQ